MMEMMVGSRSGVSHRINTPIIESIMGVIIGEVGSGAITEPPKVVVGPSGCLTVSQYKGAVAPYVMTEFGCIKIGR